MSSTYNTWIVRLWALSRLAAATCCSLAALSMLIFILSSAKEWMTMDWNQNWLFYISFLYNLMRRDCFIFWEREAPGDMWEIWMNLNCFWHRKRRFVAVAATRARGIPKKMLEKMKKDWNLACVLTATNGDGDAIQKKNFLFSEFNHTICERWPIKKFL